MTGWLDFVSKKCQTNIREIFVSGGPDKLEKTKKLILYFNFVATRYETETKSTKYEDLYFVFCLPQGLHLVRQNGGLVFFELELAT
jgi:hypothetical protein